MAATKRQGSKINYYCKNTKYIEQWLSEGINPTPVLKQDQSTQTIEDLAPTELRSVQDQGTQYEIQVPSEGIQDKVEIQSGAVDPWDEYKSVFNLDRRYIKLGREAIVDVIVKLTVVDRDSQVDRYKLINAVVLDQLRDRNYKIRVSSLVSELLCEGIREDNLIRGLRLKA